MPFTPNFDEFVLSYLLRRFAAGMRFLIENEREIAGSARAQLREEWPGVEQRLLQLSRAVLRLDVFSASRLEAVGLTDRMLYLKRQVVDLSLGRDESHAEFSRRVESVRDASSPDVEAMWGRHILVQGPVNWDAFIELLKELLASLGLALGIKEMMDYVSEFVAVVDAVRKINRGARE
jgi:hypothetical protein